MSDDEIDAFKDLDVLVDNGGESATAGGSLVPLDVAFAAAMGERRLARVVPPRSPLVDDEILALDDEILALDDDSALGLAPLSRPNLERRELEFPTGPVWAPAGGQTTITIRPQCAFRCEKVIATDTGGTPGMNTSIVQVAIGQKIQRPGNTPNGTLTAFFAPNGRANGITFDTAHPWEDIAITVAFSQACTFYASLFGTADVDGGDAG